MENTQLSPGELATTLKKRQTYRAEKASAEEVAKFVDTNATPSSTLSSSSAAAWDSPFSLEATPPLRGNNDPLIVSEPREEMEQPTIVTMEEPKEGEPPVPCPGSPMDGVPKKADGFIQMPYFAGEKYMMDWPAISRINGEMQTPVSIDTGLLAQNLADPTTLNTYIDPELQPQTEEEWLAQYAQSFDDLQLTAPVEAKNAKAAFNHRIDVERAFVQKNSTRINFVHRYQDKANSERMIRFQFRYTNQWYAISSCVTSSDKVEAIYEDISRKGDAHELSNLNTDMKREIEATTKPAECVKLLETIHTLKAGYEAALPDKADFLTASKVWLEMCIAKNTEINRRVANEREAKRLEKLKAKEAAADAVVGDATKIEEDDEETVDEEEEATGAPAEAGVEDDENLGLKYDASMLKPSISVGFVSFPIAKEEDCVLPFNDKEFLETKQAIPEPNPKFSPYKLFGPNNEPETRFDWITDHAIYGKLYALGTMQSTNASKQWRNLKTSIRVPCAMDGLEKELLVVDHERVQIIAMPSGKPTGECYWIAPNGAPTNFKLVTCSLSKDYILVSGYQRGQDVASVFIIHRKTRWLTVLNTNVPLSAATLSSAQPHTVLLGFTEGSMLRFSIPVGPKALKTGKRTIRVYSSVHHFVLNDKEQPEASEPRADEVRDLIQKELSLQRKAHGKDHIIEPMSIVLRVDEYPDWVMHVGNPVPVTRIREHGRRIACQSKLGIHLFKVNGLTLDKGDRRTNIKLRHNAGYDFKGNLLILHKHDNSMQMINLHTFHLQVTMEKPRLLQPQPPESTLETSSVALGDEFIVVFHPDGSRRMIELDTRYVITPAVSTTTTREGAAVVVEADFPIGVPISSPLDDPVAPEVTAPAAEFVATTIEQTKITRLKRGVKKGSGRRTRK